MDEEADEEAEGAVGAVGEEGVAEVDAARPPNLLRNPPSHQKRLRPRRLQIPPPKTKLQRDEQRKLR